MEAETVVEVFPWAVEGTRVAIHQWSYSGPGSLSFTRIKSVTNTRVNLENGRVFYLPKRGTNLVEVGVDRYRSANLVTASDPVVSETADRIRKQQTENEARTATESFNRNRSVEAAHTAIQALQQYISTNQ